MSMRSRSEMSRSAATSSRFAYGVWLEASREKVMTRLSFFDRRRPCVRHVDDADRAGAGLSHATDHLDRAVAGGRSGGRTLPRGRAAPVGSARQVGRGG